MPNPTKYNLNGKDVKNILKKVNIGYDKIVNTNTKVYSIVAWESYLNNTDTHMISVRRNENGEDKNIYLNNISESCFNKLKEINNVKIINHDELTK